MGSVSVYAQCSRETSIDRREYLSIGTVHFRNVRVDIPRYKYIETFHDNGDCDMLACLRVLHEVGYRGAIYPDHTPYLTDDTHDTRAGWAFASGQMVGLRAAVYHAASDQ